MQPYLASLVSLAGIAAYVAVHEAWIGLSRREADLHRRFAPLAAVLAVYGLLHAVFQVDPQAALAWGCETAFWIAELAAAALLLDFVVRFTGQDQPRLRLALTAGLAAAAVAALLLPHGLRAGPIGGLRPVTLPWDEVVHHVDAPFGVAYAVTLALVAGCLLTAAASAWRAWREGRSGRQLALLVALACIALAVVNNVLADVARVPTVTVIPHAFILLAAIMGQVLSSELARAGALEARLRRAEQFAAVGRFAGGVAHDFGNVLTGVLGHAELLDERLADRPGDREAVRAIATAARRGTALTRQLLAFARGAPETAHRHGVAARTVLAEVAGLVRAGSVLEVTVEAGVDAGVVACDSARLHAALLNLAVNARDAMPHGGVLRLGAARRDPPVGVELRHRPRPGPMVELWVSDTGSGIPAEVLPHVFDLQYTTKGELGTGLGLPQVDETVQLAGGCLRIETAPGNGTTVRLWLPLCEAAGAAASLGGRVLLVAGSTSLDQVLATGLHQLGYEIVRLGRDDPSRLGAAVVDIDHAGDAGLGRIRALQDRLPVVVLADDPQQWPVIEGTVVLPKPTDLPSLGLALHEASAALKRRATSTG